MEPRNPRLLQAESTIRCPPDAMTSGQPVLDTGAQALEDGHGRHRTISCSSRCPSSGLDVARSRPRGVVDHPATCEGSA